MHSLTLSTCSRFSSLSWSWFLSHRAKSLSCVTAPRVSLSLAYSDFTCREQREFEEMLLSSVDVELFPKPSHKRGCLEDFSDDYLVLPHWGFKEENLSQASTSLIRGTKCIMQCLPNDTIRREEDQNEKLPWSWKEDINWKLYNR